MISDSNKYISINSKTYKKCKNKILDDAKDGIIRAFIKHPINGNIIRVHPDIVRRMKNGETFSLEEIENKKFD